MSAVYGDGTLADSRRSVSVSVYRCEIAGWINRARPGADYISTFGPDRRFHGRTRYDERPATLLKAGPVVA